MKRVALVLLALLFISASGVGLLYREAVRDPVVRRATLALPDWPAGATPITVALLSDLHLGNAATDETRLSRVTGQVTALRPDLILIAGDLVAGHEPGSRLAARLVAPLSRLRARLGVVAVLGNHDWWVGAPATRRALAAAGIVVLSNQAVTRGPLALGGLDDDFTRHDDLRATVAAMRARVGARVLLAHTPDSAPRLPADVTLLLAGHTHCGQAVLPVIGAPISVSREGNRYRCGKTVEGTRRVIVSAGIGTSMLPLRIGAPPDLWLLTLGSSRQLRTDRGGRRLGAGQGAGCHAGA